MMANCAMEATHLNIYMDVFACFTKCQGFFLPPLANNGVLYSWKGLAVAQYSSILFQVPSNFICVVLIHQKLPALKSTLWHFVLLLSTLQFSSFVQPVKPPWLANIMLRVPHTAGFSGSCPVSENLTYGHSSRGVAWTKVLFILPRRPPASQGSPDGLRSQTGNLAVTAPTLQQACRPQLPSESTGNFLHTMKHTPDAEVW